MSTLLNKKKEILERWSAYKKCTCKSLKDKCSNCLPHDSIESFLASSLDSYAKAILEEVEGMKKEVPDSKVDDSFYPVFVDGYNKAHSDISSIINDSIQSK